MKKKIYKIYKIVNNINTKVYVGQTTQNIEVRFGQHRSDSKQRSRLPLHNAMRKYGKENFFVYLLEDGLTKKQAAEKEKEYIKKFKSLSKQNGYNVSTGGECGAIGAIPWSTGLTKENNDILAKISEMQKGEKNSFFGKTHSDKNKKNWSKNRRGKNHGMFGVKRPELSLKNSQKEWTDEEKMKLSIANGKPILCIENSVVYYSMKEAALRLGIGCIKSIAKVLKKRAKSTKGYSFVYANKENKYENS